MYTQCPECLTIYEIDEDALQASLGIVHCGRCQKRFDALRTLSDTLPLEPQQPLPEQDPAAHTPILTAAVPPSAFELAARQRHHRDATQAAAGTSASASPPHADALEPVTPPPDAPLPEARDNADNWFADIESEFAAAATVRPPDAAEADADTDIPWSVEQPDAAAVWPEPGSDPPDKHAGTEEAASALEPVTGYWPDFPALELVDAAMASTHGADAAATGVVTPRLLEDETLDTGAAAPDLGEAVAEVADALPADAAQDSTPNAAEPDTAAAPEPVYVPPRRRFAATAGLAWAAGCLVLVLVLAAQLAWAHRVDLLRNPSTHPWVARVCQSVPCRLPPIRDIAKLELLSRDVRPDPNAAGALMITATVRNNAAFRQPWPIVVVKLTDIDNHPVAMRRFRPAAYLPNPARRAAGIAPGETAALAFEVADPGKSASGFQFSFE